MSTEKDNDNLAIRNWIAKFEELCSSDELSIDKLRTMSKEAPPYYNFDAEITILEGSSCIHRVCLNKKVTLEIVEYLVDLHESGLHDDSIRSSLSASSYPLHLACFNKDCPSDVLELLIAKCGPKDYFLNHMVFMNIDWGKTGLNCNEYGGTPLHYYLSRASNVDLNIVKQLVAKPEALLSADSYTKCTPIHILMCNENIVDMYDVVKYLVETNPSSLKAKDEAGYTPLHIACLNEHITTRIVKLLLEAWPNSVHQRDSGDHLPITCLCGNYAENETQMDDKVAIDILQLLLEAYPDSVSQVDDDGELPLHVAATNKSPAFCKLLVDAYPESVKTGGVVNCLPLHCACNNGRIDAVEYLFGLYPESLHIRNNDSLLPIHVAVNNPGENTAEIVKFLLLQDPDCLSRPVARGDDDDFASDYDGCLPLHLVWLSQDDESYLFWDKSNVTELLFDLYPEAILIQNEQGQLPIDILRENLDRQRLQDLVRFLQVQMIYARQAQDENYMRTPDSNGSLPLHNALFGKAPLGSIKLLVRGNPDAVRVPDGIGMRPLDIASEVSTVGVIKHLAELAPDLLNACDMNKNYLLHHACRGGNCEVIEYLLERPMSSASVSERNDVGMLPIHLFCEFVKGRGCEGETLEYTETIWRLLTAYPETVLNW